MYIHNFNPVLLDFGAIKIHYYGLIFAGLLIATYFIGKWYFTLKEKDARDLDTLFFLCVIGTIIGARLGHVFFYNWRYFMQYPLEIFAVWNGGLSSHGAVIGLAIALFFSFYLLKKSFLFLSDAVSFCGSLAVFMIRIANFINGEIVGRVTDVPWAVVFPCNDLVRGQCGPEPRHPSQLYEALVGILLFIMLFFIIKKGKYRDGLITGLFLTIYFSVRFFLEFFKEYDGDLLLSPLTNGQVLSIPAIFLGIVILAIVLYTAVDKKR